ncbi:GPGG-motif small membrane protein [Brevibacterium sp. UCMA 11752]|uniref:GPGG-motif small membrane protein n=1 Tax=Brevibacterium sp. UCMA 11752 TaxID=2745946 RepID=UPI001F29102A|nr:GPGG-motif small membrane protein [Brevibacterium sp. UCMA 11752]MCF2587225.1 hypothetical protein [Brevibacterium sp. UCMA 11752]
MLIIFWVVAAILTVSGVILLFRKEFKWGIILIIVACIVGPLLANFFGGPPAGPRSTSESSPSSDAAIVSMRVVSQV